MGDYKSGAVFDWQSKISTQGGDSSGGATASTSQTETVNRPNNIQPQTTPRPTNAIKKVSHRSPERESRPPPIPQRSKPGGTPYKGPPPKSPIWRN